MGKTAVVRGGMAVVLFCTYSNTVQFCLTCAVVDKKKRTIDTRHTRKDKQHGHCKGFSSTGISRTHTRARQGAKNTHLGCTEANTNTFPLNRASHGHLNLY